VKPITEVRLASVPGRWFGPPSTNVQDSVRGGSAAEVMVQADARSHRRGAELFRRQGTRTTLGDLYQRFPAVEAMSVVDLGGAVETWLRAPVRPARVTIVNLSETGVLDDSRLVPVLGDACDAATELAEAGGQVKYDLAFSNSLIEHVGGHARRQALAEQILAPRHWVQTPYRYFPIEPHWLFPLMQFLPVVAIRAIAYRWPLAHSRPDSRVQAENEVLWTELISVTELRGYFPNSQIKRERFAGLTKSIIAIATHRCATATR
jgi:hypothetical protein